MWGVIPAAGRGRRLPGDAPKQYRQVGGRSLLDHCLARILTAPGLQGVVVALAADDQHWRRSEFAGDRRVRTVIGGGERADSVLACLDYLSADGQLMDCPVLVHDAARPLLPEDALLRLLAGPPGPDGAILAIPAQDTLKCSADGARIDHTLDRSQVWLAQTPQYFELGHLRQALRAALVRGLPVTDEASCLEAQRRRPRLVLGDARNFKVTTPADFELAARLLESG